MLTVVLLLHSLLLRFGFHAIVYKNFVPGSQQFFFKKRDRERGTRGGREREDRSHSTKKALVESSDQSGPMDLFAFPLRLCCQEENGAAIQKTIDEEAEVLERLRQLERALSTGQAPPLAIDMG